MSREDTEDKRSTWKLTYNYQGYPRDFLVVAETLQDALFDFALKMENKAFLKLVTACEKIGTVPAGVK